MQMIIEGKEMDKEDMIAIGKFFTKFFKDRKDLCSILITDGTMDMTKEECQKLLVEMFEGRKCYTKIIEIKKEGDQK